jgi:nucleotide-binding universal stress UspA family protein
MPRMENAQAPTIVVGVDGSACSSEALAFAIEEARLRKAGLRIVTAWDVPPLAYSGPYATGIEPEAFETGAKATSAQALERAREIAPELAIEAITPNAGGASALLDAAKGATLLVVGSRGHGGFTSLLLGSVSTQLAQHAPCPVTIFHGAMS